jgi:hypothetical protein
MAIFQISLINPTTGLADVTVSDGVLTVVDHSNYDTNTEAGHARANFSDFYKIKLVLPNGNSYVYGSTIVTPKDASVITPSAGGTGQPSIAYTYPSGDGIYWLYVYSLPTYASGASYLIANAPYVYYNGGFWNALQNTSGNAPAAGAYWSQVTDIDTLPSKYRIAQRIVIYADAKRTYARRVYNANVINNKIGVDWENLIGDPEFVDAVRLFVSINAIPIDMAAGDWTSVDTTINFTKQIASKYEV